jgi:signal transduction histidine kinase/ActR/RegA family two-component response regulator
MIDWPEKQYSDHMELQQYTLIEQTRTLYKNFAGSLIGTLGVSFLTVWVLSDNFDLTGLLIWLAVSLFICFIRFVFVQKFDSEKVTEDNYRYWLNLYVIGSVLSGLNWGMVSILFFDAGSPTHVLFITCIYAGYISASVFSNSSYFPSFLAFSVPSSLLFSGAMLSQADPFYIPFGLAVLFYLLVLSFFSRRSHLFFVEAQEINFKNKALLVEVLSQKEVAEKAVREKNQFLASASHDLRQPLHSLGLFVDALDDSLKEPENRKIISQIEQSTQGLNDLLHSLLDISRLDADVVENRPRDFLLKPVVDRVIKGYEDLASEKNLVFQVSVSQNLVLCCDVVLFERVVRNLIDNSVKFTDSGEVTILAALGGDELDAVKLVISDTGLGISPEEKEAVFNEFTQLNNPERDRQKGLGLGLAIVKRLCLLMNIGITLESVESQGTTVSLELPLGDDQKIVVESQNRPIDSSVYSAVVIDDEVNVLAATKLVLMNNNANVVIAMDAEHAIENLHASEVTPDIIVADFRLRKGLSGIDAIRRIREEFNVEIPAMLITGDTSPDRLALAKKAGLNVLHKPVEPRILIDAITVLRNAR